LVARRETRGEKRPTGDGEHPGSDPNLSEFVLESLNRTSVAAMTLHDFTMQTLEGEQKKLADFSGKTVLIVNVASRCGLTPHYAGLERVYRKYKDKGFEVLGFPCNQFGAQEPGSAEDIREFCSTTYDVTFPLFAKIDVNGANRSPLYQWLTEQDVGPDGSGDIVWNFGKFVVGPNGELVARFSPQVEPEDPKLLQTVESALG
jgi:glutathione peroxidase